MPKAKREILPISSNTIIIGLVGSFGSGCTTFAEVLRDRFGFQDFSLSTIIRSMADKRGVDKSERWNLQTLGNELRKEYGNNFLAIEALKSSYQKNKQIVWLLMASRILGRFRSLENTRIFT